MTVSPSSANRCNCQVRPPLFTHPPGAEFSGRPDRKTGIVGLVAGKQAPGDPSILAAPSIMARRRVADARSGATDDRSCSPMNHGVNLMSEDLNQARTFEILTAEPVRRRRRPKFYSDENKARFLQEALLPGANISAVARSHGMDPSQLFGWRRAALASGSPRRLDGEDKQDEQFTRFEAVACVALPQ